MREGWANAEAVLCATSDDEYKYSTQKSHWKHVSDERQREREREESEMESASQKPRDRRKEDFPSSLIR